MSEDLKLKPKEHIDYCIRCIRGLPEVFQEADLSRLILGFYCLGALDILGGLSSKAAQQESVDWQEWLWAQYVERPSYAGFKPGPSMTGLGAALKARHDMDPDPPHVVMTYGALLSLSILRDDFTYLSRYGLIELLRSTQQSDGSFAATPGPNGEADIRIVYAAFAISAMLDDWSGINVERAIEYIKRCRTYEGGYGQVPYAEATGGPTYCAIAALHLLPAEYRTKARLSPQERIQTIRWLVQNQTDEGGFRGRTEKVADACYCFWCGAALAILGCVDLVHIPALDEFLLECQSKRGGIAKQPADHADPYHTYLSLAALALFSSNRTQGSFEIATLEPLLNASIDTAKWARSRIRA